MLRHASMRPRLPFFLSSLTALLLVASLPATADWPQWRGPERSGKSAETGLLQEWPEGGPSLDWRSNGLGAGFSSLAVVGARIFTMGDLDDGQYAMAVSAAAGSCCGRRAWGRATKTSAAVPARRRPWTGIAST